MRAVRGARPARPRSCVVVLLPSPSAAARPVERSGDHAVRRHRRRWRPTAPCASTLDFDFDFGDDPGHGPVPDLADEGVLRRLAWTARSGTPTSPRRRSTGAPAQVNQEDDGQRADPAHRRRGHRRRLRRADVPDRVHGRRAAQPRERAALRRRAVLERHRRRLGDPARRPHRRRRPARPPSRAPSASPVRTARRTPCTSASFAGVVLVVHAGPRPRRRRSSRRSPAGPRARSPGSSRSSSTSPTRSPPSDRSRSFGVVALLVLVGGGIFAVRPAAPRRPRQGLPRPDPGPAPGRQPARRRHGRVPRQARRRLRAVPAAARACGPGEVGTLVDEKADPVDVTATLVDLAVRGWLRIEEVPRSNPKKKAKDWTLVQLKNKDGSLLPYEDELLSSIFASSTTVTLSDLKTTFAASMAKVQDGLYDHVTRVRLVPGQPEVGPHRLARDRHRARRGRRHPDVLRVRRRRVRRGHRAGAASRWSSSASSSRSSATPPPPAPPTAPPCSRSPSGSAATWPPPRRTSCGSRRARTSSAGTCPTRSCSGSPTGGHACSPSSPRRAALSSSPRWYVGGYYPGANIYWATAFASSLDRFAAVATESISAPTPGTSGGSGFSGGGFSGGGVGGGGGGGW